MPVNIDRCKSVSQNHCFGPQLFILMQMELSFLYKNGDLCVVARCSSSQPLYYFGLLLFYILVNYIRSSRIQFFHKNENDINIHVIYNKDHLQIRQNLKILSLALQHYSTNRLQIFPQMQQQLFPCHKSTIRQPIDVFHNIFGKNQIVQAYPHRSHTPVIFGSPQRRDANSLHSNEMFAQHPQLQLYTKKSKKFAQDDYFGELHPGNIVENFSMMDQKEEPYEQYANVFKGRGQKPAYLNQDMLASSSQNNDVPSRNSSLSSLSQKNQIVNVRSKRSFLHDDFKDPGVMKNHVKTRFLAAKKIVLNNSRSNSQNEMDIQNYPYESNVQHCVIQSGKTRAKDPNSYLQPYQDNRIDFSKNNAITPSQKKTIFPTFRRQDIDEQRQNQERILKIQKIQQIGCNCKKSKCLKMYCECFNLQIFCNENCNCVGCCNQRSNHQHKKAVLDALTRNPRAFNQATQKIQASFQLGVQLNQVKKGCKCKKTKCQKKYCECYNSGELCGKFCKCQGCENC